MKKKSLPSKVYVYWEKLPNEEESFLMVSEDFELIDNGMVVGIYELTGQKTISVTTKLI